MGGLRVADMELLHGVLKDHRVALFGTVWPTLASDDL